MLVALKQSIWCSLPSRVPMYLLDDSLRTTYNSTFNTGLQAASRRAPGKNFREGKMECYIYLYSTFQDQLGQTTSKQKTKLCWSNDTFLQEIRQDLSQINVLFPNHCVALRNDRFRLVQQRLQICGHLARHPSPQPFSQRH